MLPEVLLCPPDAASLVSLPCRVFVFGADEDGMTSISSDADGGVMPCIAEV